MRLKAIAAGSGFALGAWALGLVGCGRSPGPVAVHLADIYKPAAVEGRAAAPPLPTRTEWRFDQASAKGWEAFHDVSGLAVQGGRLVGRTTGDLPIVHFERTTGLDDKDVVHELEVRLRVSAGTNLSVSLGAAPKLDRDDALDYARNFPWDFTTPLVAGEQVRTYTLRAAISVPASRVRHIFIRPTDQANAKFEVESLRIVFRREHLASVPSGVGWQGLSEVYRETIVEPIPGKSPIAPRASGAALAGPGRRHPRRRARDLPDRRTPGGRPGRGDAAHADGHAAAPLGGRFPGPRGARRA